MGSFFLPFLPLNFINPIILSFLCSVSLLSPSLPLTPVMIFTAQFCPFESIGLLPSHLYSSFTLPLCSFLQILPSPGSIHLLEYSKPFLSASCFIDFYGVILSMEGKDFFDTPRIRLGTKPWTAFVWCGQFYSHSIPWVFKQLQISELKTSELVHPPSPESAQAFKKHTNSLTTCPVPHGMEVTALAGPWIHPEKAKPLN